MTSKTRESVAWLYSFSHKNNLLMRQCIASLAGAGYAVSVYDTSPKPCADAAAAYAHRCFPRVIARGYLKCDPLGRMALRLLASRHDLVIASMPDVALVGYVASKLHSIPMIYYPFELWGEDNSGYTKSRMWQKVEDRLLQKRGALAGLITQNEYRASVYAKKRRCGLEPVIVQNHRRFVDVKPSGTLRETLGVSQDTRVVLYEGSIQQERNIAELVTAARHLPTDTVLALMGPVYDGYKQELAVALESSERCTILPPVSHEDLLSVVADADVGILMYAPINLNNYYCAPCKLSDYVLAGVPVVGPAFPPLRDVCDKYGIGACFEEQSADSIASAVTRALDAPKESWREALSLARQELVWETQEPVLLSAIRDALEKNK